MSVEQPIIPGGYILLSRTILGSAIWSKPPLYLKIWVYLLTQAQHQEFKGLKRGQLWTSIPEIQEAMAYKVGFRTEKPTKKQVWGVLEWLRSPTETSSTRFPNEGTATVTVAEPMIVTTKVTHGLLVNIVNYDFYQDPKNYERNAERNDEGTTKERRGERQGNNIYKNDKNEKKIKDHVANKFGDDHPAFRLAEHLKAEILNQDPATKVPNDLSSWMQEADRMLRLDQRDPKEALSLITWAQHDSFWRTNILSMSKFRKQYDKLRLQKEAAIQRETSNISNLNGNSKRGPRIMLNPEEEINYELD